jgi:hypothetical protein
MEYSLLENSTPSAQKKKSPSVYGTRNPPKTTKAATGPYPVPEESTPPLPTYLSRLFMALWFAKLVKLWAQYTWEEDFKGICFQSVR